MWMVSETAAAAARRTMGARRTAGFEQAAGGAGGGGVLSACLRAVGIEQNDPPGAPSLKFFFIEQPSLLFFF
jgi:hypothetical protein